MTNRFIYSLSPCTSTKESSIRFYQKLFYTQKLAFTLVTNRCIGS